MSELTTAPPLNNTEQNRRLTLGKFLRTRRESLDPKRLGLSTPRKRRTPGLRREDVALLDDVGITWYTWLEQGRPIKTSAKVLLAIAKALEFNEVETRHLFMLAELPFSPTVRQLRENQRRQPDDSEPAQSLSRRHR